jgi:phosphatidyl-myo-inositol dimannoside synthase
MKTLLLTCRFPPHVGGSGRWLWEIYRRLPREQYFLAVGEHPDQVAFDASQDVQLARLPLAFADIGVLSRPGISGYWRTLGQLRRLVRAGGFDQVHAGHLLPDGWLALLLGLPYACYAYGEEVNLASNATEGGLMASRQLRWMTRLVLHRARRVITISHHTRRILLDQWGLAPECVRLVHPGVDTERFVPARHGSETRAQLGWGARPVVLTVGHLQHRKGQDQMIRALGHVLTRVPDALYAIVGAGEDEPYLRDLVRQRGLDNHVQFLGQVDDDLLVRCYQQCDLFVLPNRQEGRDLEGFGMVLLEAQACGRPVVAGASGGTADALRVPNTGRLVDCDRPEPLADVIAGLLSDPQMLARMGQAARRWVVERFDWARASRQAEAAFAGITP